MYSRIVDWKGRIRFGRELHSLQADVGVYNTQSGIKTGKDTLMFMAISANTSFGDFPALAVMTRPFWETLVSCYVSKTVQADRRTLYPDRKTRRALRFGASSGDSPLRTQNRVHIPDIMMEYAGISYDSTVFFVEWNKGYLVISTDDAVIADLEDPRNAPATSIDGLIAEIQMKKNLTREAAAASR